MSVALNSVLTIGHLAITPDVECRIHAVPGALRSDLAPLVRSFGQGDFCGIVSLFGPSDVKPLVREDFVVDQIPRWDRAVVLGSDESGRSIAVGQKSGGCAFYIVDWKHDEVMDHPSFEACLEALFDLAGEAEFYRNAFHIGAAADRLVFDVNWQFEVATELLRTAMGEPSLERCFDSREKHCQLLNPGRDVLVHLVRGEDQHCTWYFEAKREVDVREAIERWTSRALSIGLSVPSQY